MSFSNPKQHKAFQAPPVLGALEFFGMKNQLILIEHDKEDGLELLRLPLKDSLILSMTPLPHLDPMWNRDSVTMHCDTIIRAAKIIRTAGGAFDYFIIDRIDLFNQDYTKINRGAQMKGHLSMLSKKVLQDSNVIVTSTHCEYTLRELADQFFNLKTQQQTN